MDKESHYGYSQYHPSMSIALNALPYILQNRSSANRTKGIGSTFFA